MFKILGGARDMGLGMTAVVQINVLQIFRISEIEGGGRQKKLT